MKILFIWADADVFNDRCGEEMETVYLAGNEWLKRFDCDVFNVIVGMFKATDWNLPFAPCIETTVEKIYKALLHSVWPLSCSYDRFWTLDEISTSIGKLAVTYEGIPELLSDRKGFPLFHVKIVMTIHGLGFCIWRPRIRQIEFDKIMYVGGRTDAFMRSFMRG